MAEYRRAAVRGSQQQRRRHPAGEAIREKRVKEGRGGDNTEAG